MGQHKEQYTATIFDSTIHLCRSTRGQLMYRYFTDIKQIPWQRYHLTQELGHSKLYRNRLWNLISQSEFPIVVCCIIFNCLDIQNGVLGMYNAKPWRVENV